MEEYRKYEPVFGSWYLSRFLGKGSFGKVFEITREEFGTVYRSALKIITIPQDEDDVKTRLTEGSDMDSISAYYNDVLREIVNENEIMAQLKGNSNIVSYEDHQIIPHEDGIGYDILIRMELLTPLLDRLMEGKLSEEEVVHLGTDMCKALELCHRKNIIHRDIKPQNIFISDNGDYKLGDFGIARTIEKTTGGMSKKGTYKYMAPEVFRGEEYDSTVDIYSLGIVLYSLLNGNRGPFLPPPPARVSHNDEEEARLRRFRGEPIPPARDASPVLSYIISKACAASPADRYQTAEQMRFDLESYSANYGNAAQAAGAFAGAAASGADNISARHAHATGEIPAQSAYDTGKNTAQPVYAAADKVEPKNPARRKSRIPLFAGIAAAAVVLIAAGILLLGKSEPPGVNLADLMTAPEFAGYEGYGTLVSAPEMDTAKAEALLAGIGNEEMRNNTSSFLATVSYTPDVTEDLSNGDYVSFTASYDAAMAEEYGIEVSGAECSYEIEGLRPFPEYLETAQKFNGHYYKLVNDSMYWSDANAACESQNGHLATITSQEEQDFIVGLIESEGTKYNYWLGGSDADHEGTWSWVTGEDWTYANWRKGQPDNRDTSGEGDQNYLQICMVSRDDQGRYTKWWDMSDSGFSSGWENAPYYKDTKYSGYICEWEIEGLE